MLPPEKRLFPISRPAYNDAQGMLSPASRAGLANSAADVILCEILSLHVPFVGPNEIAPFLNLKPGALRHHCRHCPSLRAWAGGWSFQMDDIEHIEALRKLLVYCFWAMKKGYGSRSHH